MNWKSNNKTIAQVIMKQTMRDFKSMIFIFNCMHFYTQTLLILILFTYLSMYVPTLELPKLGLESIPFLIKIRYSTSSEQCT